MDFTSLITKDMVASAVRWGFTLLAGNEFIQSLHIDPTSWASLVSGAVVLVTLAFGMASAKTKTVAVEMAGGIDAVKAVKAQS